MINITTENIITENKQTAKFLPVTKRILFIGDVVGAPGRMALERRLNEVQKQYNIDFIIANAENSADGFGMSRLAYNELSAFGVDAFTMGNHTWDNKELSAFIDEAKNIVRPANMENATQGKGAAIFEIGEMRLAVINIMGQVFMNTTLCPFKTADMLIEALKGKVTNILVDIHAEATAEKMALGWYLDGRVSAVLGTHTHIQTNDARMLDRGTAYITDAGMTGPRDSVLGMDRDPVLRRFVKKQRARLIPAVGDLQINGVVVEMSADGRARGIETINLIIRCD